MKIIYGFISLIIITSFVLSVLTFFKVRSLESQVKNIDSLAGQRIGVIESFLVNVSKQPDGSSVYEQYLNQLKANQK